LRTLSDLGVTDLNAVPFRIAGDPQALPRTIALLGELAGRGDA